MPAAGALVETIKSSITDRIPGFVKDALGMELPFSSRLLGMYDELLAEGKAGLDQMALIELFERAAGVTVQRRNPPA